MEYRALGRTELQASVIGSGVWAMGGWLWGGADDTDSRPAIGRAIEPGVKPIDTAPV